MDKINLKANGLENIKTPSFQVNSVFKALRVLECLTPNHSEMTLTQISKMLDLPKSTLSNLIKTLESAGYLIRVRNSQSYRLGYKIMELGYNMRSTLPVVQYAVPLMEEVQDITGEIVYLTTHLNGRVLFLENVIPSKRSVTYSISGKTLPMHCTSSGKAMLSYMPKKAVERIIQRWGMASPTPNSITDPAKLLEELEHIRKRGYAIDQEEETLGIKCIATAIRDYDGYATGALSISGSVMSMTDDKYDKYAKLLAGACNILAQHAHLLPAAQFKSEDYA